MKVIVTSGATREPIDEVRFISNLSTGRTGAALAEALARLGEDVLHLRSAASAEARGVAEHESFGSADDLAERLRARLSAGAYQAVIMAAAVADYRPESPQAGKLSSSPEALTLRLVRTPKIVSQLKSFAATRLPGAAGPPADGAGLEGAGAMRRGPPGPLTVIAFKLTVGASQAERAHAVRTLFSAGGVDAVVHNDLDEIRGSATHPFHFYAAASSAPTDLAGAEALAAHIHEFTRR